jgi:hypothetical protein
MELRSYRAMVLAAMEKARSEGTSVTFSNTGPAHAAIVLEVMLEAATRTADVVSGFMDRSAWNPELIRKFLARNGKLRVILDELSSDELPKTSALSDLAEGGKIEIRRLAEPLGMHLCITDGQHVRLEHDQRACEATVTFGDKEFGGDATKIFDDIWNTKAVPLGLRQLEYA